jgi:large subunit ribosomal protein L6
MSRLGKNPIEILDGVEIKLEDKRLNFKGPKGVLELPVLEYVKVELKEKELLLSTTKESKQARSNWGTMAALIKNTILGVKEGYEKTLQIVGVGYRGSMEGTSLVLNVGFSHQVKYPAPEGIALSIDKNNIVKVEGIDKYLVGEVAAKIRRIKKPEPYKGKGIRYTDEVVRRKVGKKAVSA